MLIKHVLKQNKNRMRGKNYEIVSEKAWFIHKKETRINQNTF